MPIVSNTNNTITFVSSFNLGSALDSTTTFRIVDSASVYTGGRSELVRIRLLQTLTQRYLLRTQAGPYSPVRSTR